MVPLQNLNKDLLHKKIILRWVHKIPRREGALQAVERREGRKHKMEEGKEQGGSVGGRGGFRGGGGRGNYSVCCRPRAA